MRGRRAAARNQQFLLGILVVSLIVIGSLLFGTIKTQAAPAETSYKYYTSVQIERGDTLWNIAGNYITDEYDSMEEYIAEICELNHISAEDIHTGGYLTIPYYSNEVLD